MLTTGIFGTQFILDVLADTGHADLACSLLLRTEYPSWGYMIAQGATTLWERWNSDHGDLSMNSYNHPDFGAVCSFLFRRLAGIGAVAPGFQTIEVRPVLDSRIRRCGGEYDSIMGRISTDISQQTDGGLTLEVTLPANTEALIYLPASKHAVLKEGRRTISRRGDVRLVRRDDKEAVVSVGSGTYRLVVTP
jgi:alpha-L-rhamnosidase